MTRSWKPGDTVELVLDQGLRLELLNAAHLEMAALMIGPLVLFPIDAPETPLTRQEWSTVTRRAPDEWVVATRRAEIKLRPFMAITNQTYRLYSKLLG